MFNNAFLTSEFVRQDLDRQRHEAQRPTWDDGNRRRPGRRSHGRAVRDAIDPNRGG